MFSPTSFWQQIYLAIVKKCFTCAFAATNTAARYDSPDLNSKTRYAIVKKYFTYTFAKAKVPKIQGEALNFPAVTYKTKNLKMSKSNLVLTF